MLEGKTDIGWMVTHKYKLDQYRQALKLQSQRGERQVIRTVFEFN
jgi:threonine dehydrogenase-like Zn-dependent dehydrogenase